MGGRIINGEDGVVMPGSIKAQQAAAGSSRPPQDIGAVRPSLQMRPPANTLFT